MPNSCVMLCRAPNVDNFTTLASRMAAPAPEAGTIPVSPLSIPCGEYQAR
jgi:hypothetical protein